MVALKMSKRILRWGKMRTFVLREKRGFPKRKCRGMMGWYMVLGGVPKTQDRVPCRSAHSVLSKGSVTKCSWACSLPTVNCRYKKTKEGKESLMRAVIKGSAWRTTLQGVSTKEGLLHSFRDWRRSFCVLLRQKPSFLLMLLGQSSSR